MISILLFPLVLYADIATHRLPNEAVQREMWFGDAFGSVVLSGKCLGPTSGNLTHTIPTCEAYINLATTGQHRYIGISAATSVTYAAAATDICWTLVTLQTGTIASWTRVGTSQYHYLCNNATQPTTPTNSIISMKVTVTASAIAAVDPPAASTLTVPESQVIFTDITTGNVSASKHGFVPKLSGNGATFFDGTGAFSTPAYGVTTGTFTVTGTGFTASITGTARYVKSGTLISLFLPTLSGTSSTTAFTITGLAAAVTPTRAAIIPAYIVNSSVNSLGLITLAASSTTLTLAAALNTSPVSFDTTGWGSTGTKSLQAIYITYNLE